MSLFKIPLILSSAAAMHVSLTAPNQPSSSDVIYSRSSEWVMLRLIKYSLSFAKGLYWGVSLAEIAVIASHAAGPDTLPSVVQYLFGPLLTRIHVMSITTPFLFGTTLVVTGALIRWWCFHTLGRFFTFEVSLHKGHQLVTSGPYAIVRHPFYTGIFLQFIGVLVLHGSRTSWLVDSGVLGAIPLLKSLLLAWVASGITTAISLLLRISQEEEVIKSHFGEEWKSWAKVVRYRLVPGIY